MSAVITYNLSKKYGDRTALNGVSLQASSGTAFACIGGRKSGKTTLIRLLSGLCRPTSGDCSVLGLSPLLDASKLHSVTGTVLESSHFYKYMSLSENLMFFAQLNNVNSGDASDKASYLMHKLGIWSERDKKVSELSTRILRAANIARALMHNPKLLLLDEPELELGYEFMESLKELLINELYENGTSLFLCTSNVEYAQEICDNFAFLKDGNIIAKGNYEALMEDIGAKSRAVFRFGDSDIPPEGFEFDGEYWIKEIDTSEDIPGLIFDAASSGRQIYEARVESPTLREIYEIYLSGKIRRGGEQLDRQSRAENQTDASVAYSGSEEVGYPAAEKIWGESADGSEEQE